MRRSTAARFAVRRRGPAGARRRAEAGSAIRGRAITFIPQDPYSSFSPLFTIGDQIVELMRWKSPDRRPARAAIRARARRRDRERALAMLRAVQLPDPERMLRSTRTSCPAGSASA